MLRKVKARVLALTAVLFIGCSPVRGCIASSFMLAAESPIPVWFTIPAGTERADVAVSMDYWSGPFGRTATFQMLDKTGHKLGSASGDKFGSHPIQLNPGGPHYPSYELITVKGMTEVIEHRRMEPVFYINRDSALRQKLEQIKNQGP